jgi:hypothetical protein
MEQPLQWISLSTAKKQEKAGEYSFDAAGFMPFDHARVKLPEKNTLVEASIFSKASERDEWKPRSTALVYNLTVNGEQLASPDITFPPCTDRFWMVRFAESSGGHGKAIPELSLGWTPEQLVFVARGEGPFTLAYGSTKAEPDKFRFNDLFAQLTRQQKEKVSMLRVETGPQEILGGESMRRPAAHYRWKQWILWSVLVLGVALLAWMAFRLYKQMASQNTGEG